jgi:putative transcriptional regulator
MPPACNAPSQFVISHLLSVSIRYVYSVLMTPKQLHRLRKRLGLSQSKFATEVGVTANTVARWERGELGMSPTAVRLLQLIAEQPRVRKGKG